MMDEVKNEFECLAFKDKTTGKHSQKLIVVLLGVTYWNSQP